MRMLIKWLILPAFAVVAWSCSKDPNNPGYEFAPQMYHSFAYEPYSQIVDAEHPDYNTIPFNETKSNLRRPAAGTVPRKQWKGQLKSELAQDIMVYDLHPDSVDAAANIPNPIAATPAVLEEGQVLYVRYCAACHGEGGDGQGKVAPQYKGVPSYKNGRYATLSSGHIFHVITYGKGRMWPHGSQISPQDRWKIVHYVHELQKQ